VGARRMDRQAMMSALIKQPPSAQAQRDGTQATALVLRREEDVEAGMAAVGIELLVVAKPARECTVDLDRKCATAVAQTLALVLGIVAPPPPLAHPGPRQDRCERVDLATTQWPQCNAGSAQGRRHRASFARAIRAAARCCYLADEAFVCRAFLESG